MVQNDLCKRILYVKKCTPGFMIYSELRRVPTKERPPPCFELMYGVDILILLAETYLNDNKFD